MNENPEIKRGVIGWLRREIIGLVMLAVTLFWPAGRLDWVWGWALFGIVAAWVTVNAIVLIPRSPELLIERSSRKLEGMKNWDLTLMGFVGVLTIGKNIIAGLDFRNGWTTQVPLQAQVITLVIAALGYALVNWAMASNAFHSHIVRIQEDRGHTVATGGPYKYLRHPTYLGTVLFELASPIMLGSLWALIPGAISALLFIIRTALEDRDLKNELDGYGEYAEQVRFRLIPGIW